jgi:periplasmic divalent cation tolerance protein
MTRLIYMTVKDKSEAKAIGAALLEKRLAACVNIWEGVTSMYHWQGKLEESPEVILLAKTVAEKVPQLLETVKELHSYEVPSVLSLSVDQGLPAFLEWVAKETR